MKLKREGDSTGHGTGTIERKPPSWPIPGMPKVGGQRSAVEKMRALRQANAKLGDHAKALSEDRNAKRIALNRNAEKIRDLEQRNMQLEKAVAGTFFQRIAAVFGLKRKAGRG